MLAVRVHVSLQTLFADLKKDSGQDLIEYALVCALIAFGAIAGMQSLATSINSAFGSIGNLISTNV